MAKGLDGRHRDANGQISEKHGNTRVETVRSIYGEEALPGWRKDAKLETVREETGKSLTQLIHHPTPRKK